MIPRTREQARAAAGRYLASVGATEEAQEEGIAGSWDAGRLPELQWCRLTVLFAQQERATVDAEALRRHVYAVAERATDLSRGPFRRTLAVACVAADTVDDNLGRGLGAYQVVARGFVTPLVVDLRRGTARTAAIRTRANGFQPERQRLLESLLGGPVLVG